MITKRAHNVCFDESIFADGARLRIEAQRSGAVLYVNNRADAWLLARLGLLAQMQSAGTCSHDKRAIVLNPQQPCAGINIYTLDRDHKPMLSTARFHPVTVVMTGAQPIDLDEPRAEPGLVYTINARLTARESAIMLKYYARRPGITIDLALYHYVVGELRDGRPLFSLMLPAESGAVLQTADGELRVTHPDGTSEPLVLPSVSLVGAPVEL